MCHNILLPSKGLNEWRNIPFYSNQKIQNLSGPHLRHGCSSRLKLKNLLPRFVCTPFFAAACPVAWMPFFVLKLKLAPPINFLFLKFLLLCLKTGENRLELFFIWCKKLSDLKQSHKSYSSKFFTSCSFSRSLQNTYFNTRFQTLISVLTLCVRRN